MAPDFSGYATKHNIKCSDGRTILPGAFKHQNQVKVPLVWQHMHDAPANILGHAMLESRPDGVYAYGFFNDTAAAENAKKLVKHGDISALSIYANNLREQNKNVLHGDIKEVSLVLAGANGGAFIDNVNIQHGDEITTLADEAIIYTGEPLEHADNQGDNMATDTNTSEKTVKDVFDSMTEEQKNVVYFMLGEALEAAGDEDEGEDAQHSDVDLETLTQGIAADIIQHFQEDPSMARNVFDQNGTTEGAGAGRPTLTHAQIRTIVDDAQKMGSFKDSFLAHAGEYGITDINLLFPDAKSITDQPDLLARQAEWVPKVLGAVKHAPFAKIKSLVADLTAAEARAKGYIKGNEKTEEVIGLLRRTTGPTTVYKKQKLDRDDILDITDFDVIAWLKWEIRFMLNEELARAILIGDGRSNINPDKIKDPAGAVDGVGIRSIANDNPLYAVQVELAANVSASVIIDEVARARTQYRGSGNPTFYTTDKIITDLLLQKDKMNRRLYDTEAALASALRVKEIVAVEVLEETPNILGIMVNLVDYTVGANRGGELSFFEDFDIDFNQNKYLLETRVSGALTKPKSAIVIRRELGTEATASAPSFDGATDTITIPTTTGVDYTINDEVVTGSVVITEATDVHAVAKSGYYLAPNSTTVWTYQP